MTTDHQTDSLLAPVAAPDGLTASDWRTDARGHLLRDLSDGRIQHADGEVRHGCRHCSHAEATR